MRLEDVLQGAAERQEGRQGAVTMRGATMTFDGADSGMVYEALRPEAGRDVPKAHVSMVSRRNRLTLGIEAGDTSALRAAVNSYLRWADVAVRVGREVKRGTTALRNCRARTRGDSSCETGHRHPVPSAASPRRRYR